MEFAQRRKKTRPEKRAEKKVVTPPRRRIGSADAHNSNHYFDSPSARSVANLAVQWRLGLLPKRWVRIDSLNPDYPRVTRPNLACIASALAGIFLLEEFFRFRWIGKSHFKILLKYFVALGPLGFMF
jgi:hypothetical protein